MGRKIFRLTEQQINKIFRQSLLEDGEKRYDRYGGEIKRGGQGWGVDPTMQNRQGYNEDGTKGPWFSRSVAVATAVLIQDNGQWYVLANERGTGTPDYQGYWNLPCGYLDYNETAENAAMREVYEETGIRCENIKNIGHSTSPNENRQNVCFYFISFLSGSINDYRFSKDNMEEGEVGGIKWVPLSDADSVKWAFDHDQIIEKIKNRYSYKMYGDDNQYQNPLQMLDKLSLLVRNEADTEDILSFIDMIKSKLNN